MTVRDLVDRAKMTLRDTSLPIWLPDLTDGLAEAAWLQVERNASLTKNSYGTLRFLRQDPGEERQILARFSLPSSEYGVSHVIPVELLPEDVSKRWSGPGVRFFSAEEVSKASDRVNDGLRILGSVPSVGSSVCSLVRALHLFDSGDDGIDRSFSEPGLLFSIFVSVPELNAVAGALRVAEAILHEAMHLQLTLVEAYVPLIYPTDKTYFSPWRNEYRTAQGVLHALYVFRVIEAFLVAMPLDEANYARNGEYSRKRRELINRQIQEIQGFRECVDLTPDGVLFVKRLLN